MLSRNIYRLKTIITCEDERIVRERDSCGEAFFLAMMKQRHSRFCASAAIAALALSSTPLYAQVAEGAAPVVPEPVLLPPEAAPVPAAPVTAPPPVTVTSPAPTMVTPAPVTTTARPAAPTASANASTPTRVPAATTAATRTTPTGAPRSVATEPRSAPRESAIATPVADTPVASDTNLADETVIAPATPGAVEEPIAEVAPAATSNQDALFWMSIGGAALALALALWSFVAIGRRRHVSRRIAQVERPVIERAVDPVATATSSTVTAEPHPAPIRSTWAPAPQAAPAPSMSHSGAAIALPRTMPATFEERDALIQRMVAAKPDRANPFTSPIQRRKRAKLILQSLGRDFGDREPWIDLSQYPQNWPELQRRSAAA
jgi:hypothetical protein